MSYITENALLQRIRRRLAHDNLRICRARDTTMDAQYGPYYVVDDRNCIQDWNVDPESYGRELGVLRSMEQLSAS